MKKIFTKISLLFAGLMLCAGNAWGQIPGTTVGSISYDGTFNYSTTGGTMPNVSIAITSVRNKNLTAYEITSNPVAPYKASNVDISTMVAMFKVASITTGAFTGLTAAEVIVTLPNSANPLTLSGTYAATFGDNVKVYAPSETLKNAYNAIPAWNNKVLFREAEAPHGECGANGDNLTWEFDAENSRLVIEGSGAMADFSVDGFVVNVPWKNYVAEITSVTFPEGMTRIGANAFNGSSITSLSLPSTLQSIGNYAFAGAQYVSSSNPVDVPASVTTIGNNVFTNTHMTLNFLGTTPPSFGENFLSSGNTIYVPRGYLNTYRAALGTDAANYYYPASCGENLEWYATDHATGFIINSLSQQDTLYILGSGVMDDAEVSEYGDILAPWFAEYPESYDHQPQGGPATICLPAGLTKVGDKAFRAILAPVTVISEADNAPILGSQAFPSAKGTLLLKATADKQSYINNGWNTYFSTIEVLHATGTCGDMFIWDYNPNNHSLTIEVNPDYAAYASFFPAESFIMSDYTAENPAPWNEYASAIQTLVLPSYLYNIGNYAFYGCSALTNVTIPASVKTIGDHAFDGCTSMASLEIEGEVEAIGEGAIAEEAQIVMDDNAAVGLGDDNAATIEITLETLLATTESKENEEDKKINMTIKREIQRNGHFNTICLPFDLNEEQIAASSLNGAEIFEFSDAQLNGGELHLDFKKVTSTVAGTPYLFRYNVNEPNMMELNFKGVIISELTAGTSRDFGSVTLRGTLKEPVELSAQSEGNIALLFLGANDTFFWPTTTKTVNPFRAYFTTGTPLLGAPARIRTQENVTTDVEAVMNPSEGTQKLLKNGQIIILRNGVRYNIVGQAL